jgi:hypothetical protein
VIRPLLRVLLWLLPQHMATAATVSTAGHKVQSTPGATYVQAVATVGGHCPGQSSANHLDSNDVRHMYAMSTPRALIEILKPCCIDSVTP